MFCLGVGVPKTQYKLEYLVGGKLDSLSYQCFYTGLLPVFVCFPPPPPPPLLFSFYYYLPHNLWFDFFSNSRCHFWLLTDVVQPFLSHSHRFALSCQLLTKDKKTNIFESMSQKIPMVGEDVKMFWKRMKCSVALGELQNYHNKVKQVQKVEREQYHTKRRKANICNRKEFCRIS